MTGPNHSIIWRLTGTGHGAAAWITHRSDDTSAAARTSAGSLSSRTNIVGTTWVWVIRYWATTSRKRWASKCSIITTVVPRVWADIENRNGAAWYIGAGVRYVHDPSRPNSA